MMKILIDHGADINKGYLVPPLHICVEYNMYNAIDLLINNHADVNLKSDSGLTPLMYGIAGVGKADLNTIKKLVAYGAKMNIKTKDNSTILHLAASNKKRDILKYLLEPISKIPIV